MEVQGGLVQRLREVEVEVLEAPMVLVEQAAQIQQLLAQLAVVVVGATAAAQAAVLVLLVVLLAQAQEPEVMVGLQAPQVQ